MKDSMPAKVATDTMQLVQGRDIAALMTPTPVILVTCCDCNRAPNLLSVAWHTPLSHDPPMLGISIDIHRYSHNMIAGSGEFGINIMSLHDREAVEICGNRSGKDIDKFFASGMASVPAVHIRAPMLSHAMAHIECVVENKVRTGDHCFFIGRVLYAEARADQFEHGWLHNSVQILQCIQRNRFGSFVEQTGEVQDDPNQTR